MAGPRSAGFASSGVRSARPPKGATLKSRRCCLLMWFLHPSRSDPLSETAGRRCPTSRGRRPGAESRRLIHPGRAAARGYTCATSPLPLLRPTTTDLRNLPGGSAATRLPAHGTTRQGTCHFCWSKSNPGADTTPPALMSSRWRWCEFSPTGKLGRGRPGVTIVALPVRLSFPAWRLDSRDARAPTPSISKTSLTLRTSSGKR
ncbi:hypothetical protein Pd630_LPD13008 (plasmid) [Rhodococcus opacus PD630]|nr:hypothetical protein Pd630_LPD13008 [Rhodococcus opacus PD630]